MAIFLYSSIFIVASPIMFLVIWLFIRHHRRKEAAYEEADYQARLKKATGGEA